jgi:hypothetical protein
MEHMGIPRHQYPIMTSGPTEQELYDRLKDYKKQLQADFLTSFDSRELMNFFPFLSTAILIQQYLFCFRYECDFIQFDGSDFIFA